jgi:hypothetical protein
MSSVWTLHFAVSGDEKSVSELIEKLMADDNQPDDATDFYFNTDCLKIIYHEEGFAVIRGQRNYGGDRVFRRLVAEFPRLNFVGKLEHETAYWIGDGEYGSEYRTLTSYKGAERHEWVKKLEPIAEDEELQEWNDQAQWEAQCEADLEVLKARLEGKAIATDFAGEK